MFLAVVAAVLTQAAVPAASPTPDVAAPPAAAAAPAAAPTIKTAEDKDPVICTTQPVLGSLFPRKVCARRSVREQASRIGRQQTEDIQTRRPFFNVN